MDLTGYTNFNTQLPIRGSRISLFLPSHDPNSFEEYVGTFLNSNDTYVFFMRIPPLSRTFSYRGRVTKEEILDRAIDIRFRNAIWRDLDAGATTPYVLDGGRKYRKRKQSKRSKSRKTKRI